jgi:hypothetical protein
MRFGALLGAIAFFALAPLAFADLGVVQSAEDAHLIVEGEFLNLHAGESVEISVYPSRAFGDGRGIVTDIDKATRRIAIVAPAFVPDRRLLKTKSSRDYAKRGFQIPKNAKPFNPFKGEILILRSLSDYTKNPPDFRLPPLSAPAQPEPKDLSFPQRIYQAMQSSGAPTP